MLYNSESPSVLQFGLDASRAPAQRAPAGLWESFSEDIGQFWRENLSISRDIGLSPFKSERSRRIKEVAGEESFIRSITQSSDPETIDMINELASKYPGFILTDQEMLDGLKEKNRELRAARDFALRNQTTGGKIGSFLGTVAGAITDPFNLALIPFGASWSSGVLRAMAIEAGLGAATEAFIQPAVMRFKQDIDSPFTLSEAGLNILGAGVGTAALTGLLRGGAAGMRRYFKPSLERVEGYDDLLEAVEKLEMTPEQRQADWVLGDTTEILRQSPFDRATPDADNLHLEAVRKAQADVEAGRPVDVVTVFHGTPHTFEQFDLARVGTGEGAQSFGHGLYFAENPQVAGQYVQSPRQINRVTGGLSPIQEQISDLLDKGETSATSIFSRMTDAGIRIPAEGDETPFDVFMRDFQAVKDMEKGNILRTTIPKSAVDKMLDWDKPLREQTPEVKQKLKPIIEFLESDPNFGGSAAKELKNETITGQTLYRILAGELSIRNKVTGEIDKLASDRLVEAGIPGIKYLDQGSRAGGEGTRNIVAFTTDILGPVERQTPRGVFEPVARTPQRAAGEIAEDLEDEAIQPPVIRRLAEDIVGREDMTVEVGNDVVRGTDAVSRSAREVFAEADAETKAARILKTCVIGGGGE